MPTYESHCRVCGKEHQYITTVANYKNTPECCGQPTVKEIRTAPAPPQFDDLNFRLSSGDFVKTKQHRKEVMARKGLVAAPPLEDWKPKETPELSTQELKDIRDQVSAAQNR